MYTVRNAVFNDIPAIMDVGSDTAFAVSDCIRFYEPGELEEWINSSKENIVLVAECGDDVVAFTYCKIMSFHWAMLDNFFVRPNHRGGECARELMTALQTELKRRCISYLSTCAASDNEKLGKYLTNRGFSLARNYDWYELFLRD